MKLFLIFSCLKPIFFLDPFLSLDEWKEMIIKRIHIIYLNTLQLKNMVIIVTVKWGCGYLFGVQPGGGKYQKELAEKQAIILIYIQIKW